MKKFLFVMMALVATFAFTACEKSESQVFDLTYDETTGDQAEIIAYQLNYREILSKQPQRHLTKPEKKRSRKPVTIRS